MLDFSILENKLVESKDILRRSIWVIITQRFAHNITIMTVYMTNGFKNILYLIFNSKTKVNHLNLKQMAISFYCLLSNESVQLSTFYGIRVHNHTCEIWFPNISWHKRPFVLTGHGHTKQVNSCCKIILRYFN